MNSNQNGAEPIIWPPSRNINTSNGRLSLVQRTQSTPINPSVCAPESYKVREKIWGETWQVVQTPNFELWYLNINPKSYCSRHRHELKWNQFVVSSGKLLVHIYQEGKDAPVQTYELNPGQGLKVPPGVWHRFETGVERCVAVEAYWVDNVDPDDIDRKDVGGRKFVDTGE